MLEVYKIKHPIDERYSSGLRNGHAVWSKKGKTWSSIGALKSHLSATQRFDKRTFENFYDSWIVLRFTENGIENLGTVREFRESSGCWMG